jgi:hypothetical protein
MRSTTRGRLGDHLVICDRSGQTFWRSECVKEWNGQLVYRGYAEARHPQDFLRARRENFRVPDARPQRRVEDESFSGPRVTEMVVAAPAGSIAIAVESITGFSSGDRIRVFLDDGDMYQTQIVNTPIRIDNETVPIDTLSILIDCPGTIEISAPLPQPASVGNRVINLTATF